MGEDKKKKFKKYELSPKSLPNNKTMTKMSAPNTSLSSNIVSYAANPNYTRTEGFKWFKKVYNKHNNCFMHGDPNMLYPPPEVIYNQMKNLGCSEREFKSLSPRTL